MKEGKYFFDKNKAFVAFSAFDEAASHICYELPIGSSAVLVHSVGRFTYKEKTVQGPLGAQTYIAAGFDDRCHMRPIDNPTIPDVIRAQLLLMS